MRIGIDVRIVHYARGGISDYVLRLLGALAALDADTDFCVLHSRKDRTPPAPGPNFCPVACWTPAHHRLERWTLGAEAARLRLDLLHSPDFIPPAFGYRRSVITVHDLNFVYYPQFLTAESHRYYHQQIEWAVRRADHILADSYATKSDLVSLLDVPAGKGHDRTPGRRSGLPPAAGGGSGGGRRAVRFGARVSALRGNARAAQEHTGSAAGPTAHCSMRERRTRRWY